MLKLFKITEIGNRENCGFGIYLRNEYDDHEKTCIHLRLFKKSIWIRIPSILSPHRTWQARPDDEYWQRHGGGYWSTVRREYGFEVDAQCVSISYGKQEDTWPGDKCWSYYFPWHETRRVRYDFLDADGNVVCSANDKPDGRTDFDAIDAARKAAPTYRFSFKDYDGEENIATCQINIMEWRYGTKWCKWVGYLVPKLVRKSLDINFEKEVGPGKNSWKGGTLGHSIDMLPGEKPFEAFARYGSAKDYHKECGNYGRGFTEIKEIK